MHIPDGFISPRMYIPAYVAAGALWLVALRRARRWLRQEVVPLLSVATAVSFVLMMVAVPLPGGTTAHASGVPLLAVCFGAWTSFLAVSLVLLLQALVVGVGGVTSLPVNALAVGLVGSVTAAGAFAALRRVHETTALFAAAWFSVMASALVTAVALGVQPTLAHSADGTPLFFPFGLGITIPAILGPHVLVGVGEGVLTVIAYRFVEQLRREGS
jgi:cobalt/nickel transport system permease protein